jgi:hypothetical protein
MNITPVGQTLLSGVVTTGASSEFGIAAYRDLIFNIDVNEAVTSGTATVTLEYQTPAQTWRKLHETTLDDTVVSTDFVDPVHIAGIGVKKIRANVTDYSALAGAGGAIQITVGVWAG